jgi:iron(III) transport system permease protein
MSKKSISHYSKTFQYSNLIKYIICVFLFITVICPLVAMLMNITLSDLLAVIKLPKFRVSLFNSINASVIATIISIILAWGFAYCTVSCNLRFKEFFSIFVTLPMLIPSISHGMGLVLLLGKNGIITNLLNLNFTIYGFHGIITGSVFYSFPIAYLMIVDILKYEDGSPYDAAEALGIPKISQFFSITFPYLRKPLISVFFTVFTMIFTDYGVPLVIGGRYTTLPVLMYEEVIGLLNFNRGSVISAFLLIPAVVAFIFDLINRDRGNINFIIQDKLKSKFILRDIFAVGYVSIICLIIALPLIVFLILTFIKSYPINMGVSINNIIRTLDLGAGQFLANSIIIAFLTSILGVILSWITAYFTARTQSKSSRILHLFSITSLAIPGMVLGISYVLFFKGSFLYGSLAMLILVNTTHFIAPPYLIAYNSLGKLNSNLEDVGRTLGVNRLHIILDVLIPQTKLSILEMFSYFFVNSMITISAVSFLSVTINRPVSLMITQFETFLFLEGAAFVSILILCINLLVKFLLNIIGNRIKQVELI